VQGVCTDRMRTCVNLSCINSMVRPALLQAVHLRLHMVLHVK
jgi:hypothetical protein